MTQYAQDYDETYVLTFKWDGLLYPYLGAKSVWGQRSAMFECPDDTIKRSSGSSKRSYAIAAASNDAHCTPWDHPPTYTCDKGFAGPLTENTPATSTSFSAGRRVSEIVDPAGTLQIVELQYSLNNLGNDGSSTVSRPISTGLPSGCSAGYDARQSRCGQDIDAATTGGTRGDGKHSDGWNYLFVDGHVKWILPEKTLGKGVTPFSDSFYNPKGMWSIAAGD